MTGPIQLAVCALLLAGSDDFTSQLNRAISRYEKLDDAKALELLDSAKRAARTPKDLAEVALYSGLAPRPPGDRRLPPAPRARARAPARPRREPAAARAVREGAGRGTTGAGARRSDGGGCHQRASAAAPRVGSVRRRGGARARRGG